MGFVIFALLNSLTFSFLMLAKPPVVAEIKMNLISSKTNFTPILSTLPIKSKNDIANLDLDYRDEPPLPVILEKKSYRQDIITQRDIEKEKRNDPFWKKWFAELLAATVVLFVLIWFFCWYWKSRMGERRDRSIKSAIGMTVRNLQFMEAQASLHAATVPELQRNLMTQNFIPQPNPVQPLKCKPLCSKPACVCDTPASNIKGKRRWNYKEDNEAYAPA